MKIVDAKCWHPNSWWYICFFCFAVETAVPQHRNGQLCVNTICLDACEVENDNNPNRTEHHDRTGSAYNLSKNNNPIPVSPPDLSSAENLVQEEIINVHRLASETVEEPHEDQMGVRSTTDCVTWEPLPDQEGNPEVEDVTAEKAIGIPVHREADISPPSRDAGLDGELEPSASGTEYDSRRNSTFMFSLSSFF